MGSLERYLNSAGGANYLELPFDKGSPTTIFFQTRNGQAVQRQYCMVVPGQGGREVFLKDLSLKPHSGLRRACIVQFMHSLLSGQKWPDCIQTGASVHMQFQGLFKNGPGNTSPIVPNSICVVPYAPMAEFDGLYLQYLAEVRRRRSAAPAPRVVRPVPEPVAAPPESPMPIPVPEVEEIQVTIPDPGVNLGTAGAAAVIDQTIELPLHSSGPATTVFLPDLRVDDKPTMWVGPGPDPRRHLAPSDAGPIPTHDSTRPAVLERRPLHRDMTASDVSAYIDREYPQGMGRILIRMYRAIGTPGTAETWFAALREMTQTCWTGFPKKDREYVPADAAHRTFLSFLAEQAGTTLEDVLLMLHREGAGAQ